MKEVMRTADPVRLSFARAVLDEAGIAAFVLDEGMSSMYPGMAGFFDHRLMVDDDDFTRAARLLQEALNEINAQDSSRDHD
ncbi:putative signal transducing protein [Maricaulis sp. CAU 1757]